jgi:hypothetical protein
MSLEEGGGGKGDGESEHDRSTLYIFMKMHNETH